MSHPPAVGGNFETKADQTVPPSNSETLNPISDPETVPIISTGPDAPPPQESVESPDLLAEAPELVTSFTLERAPKIGADAGELSKVTETSSSSNSETLPAIQKGDEDSRHAGDKGQGRPIRKVEL